MPIYDWKCERCGAEEITVASMDESDVPPKTETETRCGEVESHDWKRVPPKVAVRYGAGWGGRQKGNW
jgi:predicted nucleic acid-binding Zn ribbon protein